MDYDSYITKIDGIIAELTDMKSHLELGRTEVMAGRCPPVIGNDTKTLNCVSPDGSWDTEKIQHAFDLWMNRLSEILALPSSQS